LRGVAAIVVLPPVVVSSIAIPNPLPGGQWDLQGSRDETYYADNLWEAAMGENT
jgi:hypothetical protein